MERIIVKRVVFEVPAAIGTCTLYGGVALCRRCATRKGGGVVNAPYKSTGARRDGATNGMVAAANTALVVPHWRVGAWAPTVHCDAPEQALPG
jgi:hypothetical protein